MPSSAAITSAADVSLALVVLALGRLAVMLAVVMTHEIIQIVWIRKYQNKIDGVQASWTAWSPAMDTLPGNSTEEVAARARHLWRALDFASSAAFAAAIGVTPTRWNNVENSGSLSKEIAFKIVQKFPGITTDYLWFGRMDGMPLQRVRQFEITAGVAAKGRTRS
jgi:hypothetical protein